jgi:hypothetical protein
VASKIISSKTAETYLIELYRYSELNPVRAELVEDSADYFGPVINVMRYEKNRSVDSSFIIYGMRQ